MSTHDDIPPANDDNEARALRRLVDEARAEPLPELDWEAVEQQLMSRVALEAAARRRRRDAPKPSWPGVLGLLAAAAALVLLFTRLDAERPADSPASAVATVDLSGLTTSLRDGQPSYDVGDLRPRSMIESRDEPVRFTLPGVVTWTLAPHGRVRIESGRAPHVLTLEQGSVYAEVVPASRSDQLVESFVVEAAGTRVAVHGTVFSVTRHADRVDVEVTRGSVTVGPAGHRGVTTGRLLVGPAHASFGLDGTFQEMLALPTPSPLAAAAPHPGPEPLSDVPGGDAVAAEDEPAPAAVSTATSPDATKPDATEPPSEVPPSTTEGSAISTAQAQALVASCLNASAPAAKSDDTQVTVSSQVTAFLDADGQVTSVRFAPPLRPDLQSRCGATLFGHTVAAAGQVTFSVQVSSR